MIFVWEHLSGSATARFSPSLLDVKALAHVMRCFVVILPKASRNVISSLLARPMISCSADPTLADGAGFATPQRRIHSAISSLKACKESVLFTARLEVLVRFPIYITIPRRVSKPCYTWGKLCA